MRFHSSLLATCSLWAATTAMANAADPVDPIVTDTGQLSFNLSATYFNMDVANGLGSVVDTAGFAFIRQAEDGSDLSAVGVSGSMEGWKPADLPRIGSGYVFGGIEGAFVSDDDSNSGTLEAGEFLDTLPINGAVSPGAALSGAGTEFTVSDNVDFWRIGAFGGVGRDIAAADGHVGFGVYGGYSSLQLNSSIQNAAGTNFIRLDEKVGTFSIGPMVTGQRRATLANGMSVFVGGKLAVLYADGDLDATQTASNFATPVSVDDNQSDIAFLGEINAGVDVYTTAKTTVSLVGALEWRNDVYKIVNPRSSSGLVANNPASYSPGPAQLRQTGQFSSSLGVKATIHF